MWLLDYMTKNSISKNSISCGEITQSSNGSVAVDSEYEHRDIKIVAPYGIAYCPPLKHRSVVLPIGGTDCCVGVVAPDMSLEPGELMLYSKGGASIVLKNDGTVLINGKVYG